MIALNIRKVFFLPLLISVTGSCTNVNSVKDQPIPEKRFTASHNGDTAIAILKISKSIFKGQLEIKYKRGYKDSGDVKGSVKGDTLIGDFHFKRYGIQWKRDPIIFLKRGNKLIKGEGVIKYTFGFPGFNRKIPIDFNEKNVFVFK